ncbi:MAG TPA: hypothetical protein VGM87_25780 [Roseomonas sp.]|jgi:hypothetical protein
MSDFSLEARSGHRALILAETVFPDALEAFVARSLAGGGAAEFWCFASLDRRRQAEQTLAAAGQAVRIRAAYKPLLHALLEEVPLTEVTALVVQYPVDPRAASAKRFLSEAYPLAAMLGSRVRFEPRDSDDLTYRLRITYGDGRTEQRNVFAPNRLRPDASGEAVFIPCGWQQGGGTSGPVTTEHEQIFEAAMEALRRHAWPGPLPFFERLEFRAAIAGFETANPLAPPAAGPVQTSGPSGAPAIGGSGTISTFDALHEDLYFSAQEFFIQLCGKPIGDRTVRSGQVVPLVRPRASGAALTIEALPYDRIGDQQGETPDLDRAEAPIGAARLAAALAALPGSVVQGRSVQGRPVTGIHRDAPGPAILITGGQHANEPTGILGALRAARVLARQPDAPFGLVALENPDGYALRGELAQIFPHHILHAARFTALGDDVPSREAEPLFEKAVRLELARRTGAIIHCNLHGYPAHEWTRPASGYLTQAMEEWAIPRGFFLILRAAPGWEDFAEALVEHVALALGHVPGLLDFNARSLAAFQAHTQLSPPLLHGIPVSRPDAKAGLCPVTLTAEFPDESIYGEAFILGHETQMRCVLAAHAFLVSAAARALMPPR